MISIITPTLLRNELIRCCRQIEKQSVKWEHILIVDIPETTVTQIKEYQDILEQVQHPNRKIYFCPIKHRNYGNSCRHSAWNYCTQDYIIYIDDDDYFTDNAFSIAQSAIIKNNFPDICVCSAKRHGRIFYNKPIGGCKTVQGQYLHKREVNGKAMQWLDTEINSSYYMIDSQFIEFIKKNAATIGYADTSDPIVIVERPSCGQVNKSIDEDEAMDNLAWRKEKNIEYSLILTTHKRPVEAGSVLKEIDVTTKGFNKEILVIGHMESDKPTGENLPEYTFMVQPKRGRANSLWYGAKECSGRWFVWLCDDHKFSDREWFSKANKLRKENPGIKVIQFNAKTSHKECTQIGMCYRGWYLRHYPEPVYDHYGWDNEIHDWAIAERVFYNAENIVVEDIINGTHINGEFKGSDYNRWVTRRNEYKLINGRVVKI